MHPTRDNHVIVNVFLHACVCLFQADERRAKLLDSYDLQRFLSDFRDLTSWVNSMMALVSSDELAKDVTGAEALLERHQVRFYLPPLLFSTPLLCHL